MNTFKNGDRVTHKLYGTATVVQVDYDVNLIGIKPDSYPSNRYTQVHPVSLTFAVSEPKFNVLYQFTHGNTAKSSGIPMNRKEVETYLTNFPSWDTVESITITRAKG